MKRRFRVNRNYPSFGVKAGDVGTHISQVVAGDRLQVRLAGPVNWDSEHKQSPLSILWFSIKDLTEISPLYERGDKVRVKAGSPVYRVGENRAPAHWEFGAKLTVIDILRDGEEVKLSGQESTIGTEVQYLESWNDDEHWNGAAWVKKEAEVKPQEVVPESVTVNGVEYVRKETNVAWPDSFAWLINSNVTKIKPVGEDAVQVTFRRNTTTNTGERS